MNVKESSGVRRPSPTLWVMVQRVTEEQWRFLKPEADVFGKGSTQFKLIEFLRGMKVYDHEAEKKAFAHCDLYTVRRNAKKWLIRIGRRLAFFVKEVEELYGDVQVLIGWGHFEEAYEHLGEAKEVSIAQEEFWITGQLLQLEKRIVRELFEGEELTQHLARIIVEEKAINGNIALVTMMAEHLTHHMEPVKNKLAATGVLDHEAVAAYFGSSVHELETSSLPVSIQIEKLTMDEFFYNMLGDFEKAAELATRTVEALSRNSSIRDKMPDKYPKVLMNLVAFYSKLDWIDKVHDVIAMFEEANPFSEERRSDYLHRYIFVLFQAAIDCQQQSLASKAMIVWEDQRDYLLAVPPDNLRTFVFVCVCWNHLAEGRVDEARSLFYHIKTKPMSLPRLFYQTMGSLLHMVILFEDLDETGIDSVGLQYKRKLKKYLPEDAPALTMVTFLRTKANMFDKNARQKSLKRLADDLRRCQSQIENQRNFWFDPVIKWIDQKLSD